MNGKCVASAVNCVAKGRWLRNFLLSERWRKPSGMSRTKDTDDAHPISRARLLDDLVLVDSVWEPSGMTHFPAVETAKLY